MDNNQTFIAKKDVYLSITAGFFIGLLSLPVLKVAKPELYNKLAIVIIPFFFIATPIGIIMARYIGRKIILVWQIAKFGVIGALNTLVDLGVMACLLFIFRETFLIQPESVIFSTALFTISFYTIYKAISFIIANINSYFWNKYWTFEQKTAVNKGAEFTSFLVVSIIGFVLNITVASLIFQSFSTSVGISPDQGGLLGALAGTIAGLGWNFIGYKLIVFKK